MRFEPLPSDFFAQNRKRFMAEMEPGAMAVFHANDSMPRSGDQFYPFRQNTGLYYLSGITQEETMLVLYPDSPRLRFREFLILRKPTNHLAIWDGYGLSREDATRLSGVEKVVFHSESEVLLHELILSASAVYLNPNENDRFRSPVLSRDHRYAETLRQQYPGLTLLRAPAILKRLQMKKQEAEIQTIAQAVHITGKAFDQVLRATKPGVWEYEVEAEIIGEFIRNRADGHAYAPIIASGPNACTLHYIRNNRQCQDGELLLLDFGCEYGMYNADLSRTIPVNGRFTPRQKQVYQAVLHILRETTRLMRPGIRLDELQQETGRLLESALIELGLLDRHEVARQDKNKPLYKKYFMHGVSHHLGLDVHDLCRRHEPLAAGMVLTCEPGIYIPEESLGIRLENDILITENDPIDLCSRIPIEIEDIEDRMRRHTFNQ